MTDVVMPQMGESIVEGTLTKWLKKAGDKVERDEPLFEISTDKVDTEIPSPAAGTLTEVLVEEGKTVGINTVVARISDGAAAEAKPAEAKPAESKPAASKAPEAPEAAAAPPPPEPAAAPPEEPGEPAGPLSPLVRRMARELNIDLSRVKGTGAGGRITKQDMEAYQAQTNAAQTNAAQTNAAQTNAAQTNAAPAPKQEQPAAAPPPKPEQPAAAPAAPPRTEQQAPPRAEQAKVRIEPMSTMRMKIAEHMVMSQATSAHVTTIHKVDMTRVEKIRQKQKADFQARYGISLTYLPFIARAAVEGLRTFPLLNASIEGSRTSFITTKSISGSRSLLRTVSSCR